MQQHGHAQPQVLQARISKPQGNSGLPQSVAVADGRSAAAAEYVSFTCPKDRREACKTDHTHTCTHRKIPGRKMAAADSRQDPLQRMTNPQASTSRQHGSSANA